MSWRFQSQGRGGLVRGRASWCHGGSLDMLLTNSGVVELLETQGIFNSAMLLDIAKRIIWCL
jgi:hypothetical protein